MFRPRVVWNASRSVRLDRDAMKCTRIIEPAFLSKCRLLTARDTVFGRKRGRIPRDWFLSFLYLFLKEKLVPLFLKEYNTEKELSHMEDASKGAYPSIYN